MTEDQKKLIEDWISDAKVLLRVHMTLSERMSIKHRNLGIPAAILSAVVGTSVFASIGNNASVYAQVAVGVASVAASVLSTLSAFLSYSELAARHHNAGAGFADIRKELEELLMFPPENEQELKVAIRDLRDKWAKLRKDAGPVGGSLISNERKVGGFKSEVQHIAQRVR